MGITINSESTTTEPLLRTDSSLSHQGVLNVFYLYQIFALDSGVVEVQNMDSSHGEVVRVFARSAIGPVFESLSGHMLFLFLCHLSP